MDYKELASNPVSVLLQLVGAKWKLLVVKELLIKAKEYSVSLYKNQLSRLQRAGGINYV